MTFADIFRISVTLLRLLIILFGPTYIAFSTFSWSSFQRKMHFVVASFVALHKKLSILLFKSFENDLYSAFLSTINALIKSSLIFYLLITFHSFSTTWSFPQNKSIRTFNIQYGLKYYVRRIFGLKRQNLLLCHYKIQWLLAFHFLLIDLSWCIDEIITTLWFFFGTYNAKFLSFTNSNNAEPSSVYLVKNRIWLWRICEQRKSYVARIVCPIGPLPVNLKRRTSGPFSILLRDENTWKRRCLASCVKKSNRFLIVAGSKRLRVKRDFPRRKTHDNVKYIYLFK